MSQTDAIPRQASRNNVRGITRATLLKDLRLEWRSKDAINSMLFFALLVVIVFSFAFNVSNSLRAFT